MAEQQPSPTTFQIPTHLPSFSEDKDNTSYANFVNVAFNETDCCLTFLRKPRPLSLDLKAVQSGETKLEMIPLSRVYLPHDIARMLCQGLAQSIHALDDAVAKAKAQSPNGRPQA